MNAPTLAQTRQEAYARSIRDTYRNPGRATVYGIRETQASLQAYAGMSRMQAIVATAPAARPIHY